MTPVPKAADGRIRGYPSSNIQGLFRALEGILSGVRTAISGRSVQRPFRAGVSSGCLGFPGLKPGAPILRAFGAGVHGLHRVAERQGLGVDRFGCVLGGHGHGHPPDDRVPARHLPHTDGSSRLLARHGPRYSPENRLPASQSPDLDRVDRAPASHGHEHPPHGRVLETQSPDIAASCRVPENQPPGMRRKTRDPESQSPDIAPNSRVLERQVPGTHENSRDNKSQCPGIWPSCRVHESRAPGNLPNTRDIGLQRLGSIEDRLRLFVAADKPPPVLPAVEDQPMGRKRVCANDQKWAAGWIPAVRLEPTRTEMTDRTFAPMPSGSEVAA